MKLNLKDKNILLVEDHSVIREAMKHMLFGLEARHIVDSSSGATAVTLMKDTPFDIVICDYYLGSGKNGQQLLEEVRFSKLLPVNAIFIMVTVEQQQSIVLSALDNKPDDYLAKPFNAQQLLSRLERCFTRKQYFSPIEQHIHNGNPFLAIKHCEKLLDEGDKNRRLQLLKIRAELAIETGDLETAQNIYQKILKERDLPWARLGLGIIAFMHNRYEQAIGYFQQLIELYPAMLDAYDWLSKTHETTDNTLLALETIETAVNLAPQAILRQQKLALLATKAENLDTAKKAYKSAIKLGKNSVHKASNDLTGLADIYVKTNALNLVQPLLDELQQKFTNEPEAEMHSALLSMELYKKTDHGLLAKQAYENAVNLNAEFGRLTSKELRLQLVEACFTYKDVPIAESILDDLVKSNIDDKHFIDEIKQLCNIVGHENYVVTLIQNTKQELININNTGVHLFKQGNTKAALASFEKAEKIMPNNKTIVLNMAKIMIHDLKISKGSEKKRLQALGYIEKAIRIGVGHDKVSSLQSDLAKLSFNE